MTAALLCTRQLSVRAGRRILVKDLDLRVQRGQRWVLLGPNGCGKTTLLRTLAGLLDPAGGEVSIDGRPLPRIPTRTLARLRAWCPQHHHDVFALTALDVVLAGRQPYAGRFGWLAPVDERIAREQLAALDAAHLAEQDVRSLSGGERQRVAIAAALAQATPLVLLDEPMAHLDVPHQLAVCHLLAGLADRAVLMSLHDVNLAQRCCTHALLFLPPGADGLPRLLAGPLAEVLTEAHLSQAYGCPMRALHMGGLRHFLPATDAVCERPS